MMLNYFNRNRRLVFLLFMLTSVFYWSCTGKAGKTKEVEAKTPINQLNISDIKAIPVMSAGMNGALVVFNLEAPFLSTDTSYHFLQYSINGVPYVNNIGLDINRIPLDSIVVFLPFSQMNLASGTQQLDIRPTALVTLKGIKGNYNNRIASKVLDISVPTIKRYQVGVTGTSVSAKNHKNKHWDFNMFSQSKKDKYPDLIYTVEYEFNHLIPAQCDHILYRSNKIRNSLKGQWGTEKNEIKVCEGDQISLCIKDADLLEDDIIGSVSLTDLIESGEKHNMSFGLVEQCNISILEQE